MSVSPTDPSPGGSTLQFDTAEPAANTRQWLCASCKRPLTSVYHKLNEHVICSSCRTTLERQTDNVTTKHLSRAVLFGLGGTVLGAILYFAVIAITGINIGFLAIGVGYIVGSAVRKGSGKLGGVPYQWLAVVLTYVAIDAMYALILLDQGGYSGVGLAAGLVVAPILVGFDPIRLIIIAVGLLQAWRMNAAAPRVFLGPIQMPASVAPAAVTAGE